MKITADEKCYLTEVANVSLDKRTFKKTVIVSTSEEASQWKQISEEEKGSLESQKAIFDNQDVSAEYLGKVNTLVEGISEKINTVEMSVEDCLKYKNFYPEWSKLIGRQATVGFRFRHEDTLHEVIKPHTFSAEWIPGQSTASLYKVVQIEATGTQEDPIAWSVGMELFKDKYYTDKGVLYKCIRNSDIAMQYPLADLVSGGYVEVVVE